MKFKKIALLAGKAALTVIAFVINPALGIFVGGWLFLGLDTFAREQR